MENESSLAEHCVVLAVEVVVILIGVWMISRGWTDFGSTVVIVGAVGFVVSGYRLARALRQRPRR